MDDDAEGPFDELDGDERRRLFERTVPEVFKRVVERAVERSVERMVEAPENLRELVGDMKVPKEAGNYIYSQVDDTKKGIYKIVAKEIRDVLEHTNFADEIAQVLTKLSFEINTTIRFVPNEAPDATEGDDADAPGEGAEAKGSDSTEEEPKKRKRDSVIPSPQVVSKVVMKAVDRLDPRSKD